MGQNTKLIETERTLSDALCVGVALGVEALGKDLVRETKKCSERQTTCLENVTDF